MAELKISMDEIKKMLKDQLGAKNITYDSFGDSGFIVEIDLEDLKKKTTIIQPITSSDPFKTSPFDPFGTKPKIKPMYIEPNPSITPKRPFTYWTADTKTNTITYR